VRRFNRSYGPTLVEPKALLGPVPRLVGLDGNAKMSKSLGNCIYLSDPPAVVHAKLRQAVTDPARVHRHDRGRPEVCTVFGYYRALTGAESEEVACDCRRAGMGCVQCKTHLAQIINARLEPQLERQARYARPGLVEELLAAGAERARRLGAETLARVREALRLRTTVLPR